MKYEILEKYRVYLREVIENKHTADRYYFAVSKCLQEIQFNSLTDITQEYVEEYLINLKGSSNFSALKNGLKYLKKFDTSFTVPEDEFFKKVAKSKRRGTKKGTKVIDLDKVQKKINAIKNEKLKLGYRLMQLSGLRVSELAKLKKEDIKIDEQVITIDVKRGKGGKSGQVVCDPNQYLSEKLQQYLKGYNEQDNIFYKAETIKKKAGELGIECHDLRRIAAIVHRNKLKSEGMPLEEANENTKEYLRHERFSTTKRYLFNRKLKFKTKALHDNDYDDIQDCQYFPEEPEDIPRLRAARDIEKNIKEEATEYAYLYDKSGNEIMHKGNGYKDRVEFQYSDILEMENCVLTHNHPSGGTFSHPDIHLLIHAKLHEIRAVGKNGVFFLRKTANTSKTEDFHKDFISSIDKKINELNQIYKEILEKNNGKLTNKEQEKVKKNFATILEHQRDEWLKNNAHIYGYKYGLEKNK